MVEMAFALPILALIFLSIIDLGLVIREYQLLQNAAREGARISVARKYQVRFSDTPCDMLSQIQQRVVAYCAEENITISATNVTVNQVYPIPDYCGSEVTVTYPRNPLLRGAPFLPVGSIVLTGRAVFQNLYGCDGENMFPPGITCP